jgi:hypothetical protein
VFCQRVQSWLLRYPEAEVGQTRDLQDHILITSYRYTDFLVNEVTLDGKVVHLTDTDVPRRKPANKVSPELNTPSFCVTVHY